MLDVSSICVRLDTVSRSNKVIHSLWAYFKTPLPLDAPVPILTHHSRGNAPVGCTLKRVLRGPKI